MFNYTGRSIKKYTAEIIIVIEQNENQCYLVLKYIIIRNVIRHVVFVSLVRGYLDFTIYCNVFLKKILYHEYRSITKIYFISVKDVYLNVT